MKFRNLACIIALAASGTSNGALTYLGTGFAILNVNAGGNVYYDLDAVTGNSDFDTNNSSAGAYSQTITINLGESIKLGGENQTNSFFGTTSTLQYRVSTNFSGTFLGLNLPFNTNYFSNDKWLEAGAGMIEIGSSLSVGTYYLEIFQKASNGGTDLYKNEADQSANNWETRIVVVPEPTSAALGLIGTALLLRRRRI